MSADRTGSRLSILVLADIERRQAQNLVDHVRSFGRYSRHRVSAYNPRGVAVHPHLNLAAYDVVVIHWSLVVISESYVSPDLREKLRRFRGLKIQFLQDEYRWVDEITSLLRWLEVDAVFTVAPPEAARELYASRLPDIEVVTTLPGFLPETLPALPPSRLEHRPLDVAYRGRTVAPWLGRLGREKAEIGRQFLDRARRTSLRCDIAWTEHDRLYGEAWFRFLSGSKTTLGTESGASIVDFDGSIERAVINYLRDHPAAGFEQIHEAVLAPHEGNVVINVLSPRILEAASLRTALVLFPGTYSDMIRPWQHYVPLNKDLSNFEEVAGAIGDLQSLREMTDRCYEELVAGAALSLRQFVHGFDDFVDSHAVAQPRARGASGYWRSRARRPFSSRTLFGVDASAPRRAAMKASALGRMIAADQSLRRLLIAGIADPPTRARFGLHRIASDALRLGALRDAHAGRGREPDRFAVVARLEEGELSFVTHPRTAWALEAPAGSAELEAAVVGGELDALTWNHLASGPVFTLRTIGGRRFEVAVGYLGVPGIYRFPTIVALARRQPSVVWDALAALGEQPRRMPSRALAAFYRGLPPSVRSRVRTAHQRYEASGVGEPIWIFAARAVYAPLAKSSIAGYAVVRHRPLRRLAWAVLRDPGARNEVGARALTEDVLKLHLLRRAREARIQTIGHVDHRARCGVLRFASRAAPAAPDRSRPELDGIATVTWSNRELGRIVLFAIPGLRPLEIALGRAGVYEFATLRALLPERASLAADVLTPGTPLVERFIRDGRLPVPLRPLLIPRDSAARAALVSTAFLTNAQARAALFGAIVSDRRSVAQLVRDALRLRALQLAAQGRIAGIAAVEVHGKDDGHVRFVSVPVGGSSREPPEAHPGAPVWTTPWPDPP